MPEPRTTPSVVGLKAPIQAVCFDWGGTLMVDDGPDDLPMNLWPEVAAVPGARECLTALEGRVPLCVATNAAQSSRPMIEAALDRVNLLRFIDEVFCFTEIGFKNDRRAFWSAVRAGSRQRPRNARFTNEGQPR